MRKSNASFDTASASKYVQQMCKHFGHKATVDYNEQRGEAALPPGPAVMEARDGAFHVEVSANDEPGLTQAKFIIEDHIKRFAFRENLEKLDWIDGEVQT